MLELFRKSRNHLAIVVNAEDAMLGIVTFEDVLEELVGDIRDEFDIEKGPIFELTPEMALVDAEMPVRDLVHETNWPLPLETNRTLAHWAQEVWGRPPQKNESIDHAGFRLIAEEVNAHGLRRLRLLRLSPSEGIVQAEP
jgi:CBS domain containing-hemolysin-like protein